MLHEKKAKSVIRKMIRKASKIGQRQYILLSHMKMKTLWKTRAN